MNKKRFCISALFSVCLVIGFSCSIFSPDTNVGSDVVKTVDSTATNLKVGFAKIDSVFLAVSGARSVVVAGIDTSVYRLHSGVHPNQIVAGRIGNDSVVAYTDFDVDSSILAGIAYPRACSLGVDSVYLQMHYNPNINDTTLRDFPDSMVHISVWSCQRKYYPGVRNDLTTPDIKFSNSLTFSRRKPDTTFYIPLGPDIVSQLQAQVLTDTVTHIAYLAQSDTGTGWFAKDSTRLVRPDTVYIKDSVLQAYADTVLNAAVTGLTHTLQGDTAVIRYNAGSAIIADTLPFTRSVVAVDTAVADSQTIVNYSAWRERTITERFSYDSSRSPYGRHVASFHIYASAGGGLVRFIGPPVFLIRYRGPNCDTNAANWAGLQSYSLNYYFDMTVAEVPPIPSDSLVASWQADRFVEIPIDLTPIWNFATGKGNGDNGLTYSIIQDGTLFLDADSLQNFERPGSDTINRRIVYGLFDHRITNARAQSVAAYDSVIGLTGSGRLANDSLLPGAPTRLSMPVAIFLQTMYQKKPRPSTGYLYIFVRSANDFARAIIRKSPTIKFSALFSNPQK